MEANAAGVVGVDTEYGTGHLGAAGADEASESHNLSCTDFEANSSERSCAVEVLDFEDNVADFGGLFRE